MTLSGTSSVSPAFGAGTQSGPVFSPAVLTGGTKGNLELAKTDVSVSTGGASDAASATAVTSTLAAPKPPSSPAVAAAAASSGAPKTAAVSAATASTEAAKVASAKPAQAIPTKSAVVGEDGQIRELKSQGQNLSQIAVDLNISVAAVNGDLQTDIPKFVTPPPVVDTSDHSTISVFA